jgi:hypothetical protein
MPLRYLPGQKKDRGEWHEWAWRLMGASNVMAAYTRYAGKIPPLSMVLLLYMAVVSRDGDASPWYGQGHAALAALALGRPGPVTKTDLRAVERGITPLLAAGALTVERRASARRDAPSTVRYGLNLSVATAEEPSRPTESVGREGSQDPQRPTVCGTDARRNPSPRPTVCGTDARRNPSDRGTKRNHEEREEEESVDLGAAVTVSRAAGNDQDQATDFDVELAGQRPHLDGPTGPSRCGHGLKHRRRADGQPSCALCRREFGGASPVPPPPRPEPPAGPWSGPETHPRESDRPVEAAAPIAPATAPTQPDTRPDTHDNVIPFHRKKVAHALRPGNCEYCQSEIVCGVNSRAGHPVPGIPSPTRE